MSARSILMLHGWGFGPAVWDAVTGHLPATARSIAPALAGYGPGAEPLAPAQAAAQLVRQYATPGVVVGWSYGGLVALQLALAFPARVRALVLIASLPCFRPQPGWPAGLDAAGLATVQQQLHLDPDQALATVAALSARGEPTAARVRQVLWQVRASHVPAAVLAHGLAVLAAADERCRIEQLQPPLHVMLGAADRVIGREAAAAWKDLSPQADIHVLPEAGHALPISQPRAIARLLETLA